MKLVSFGPKGSEQPGVLIGDDRILPVLPISAELGLSGHDWADLLGAWELLGPRLAAATRTTSAEASLPLEEVRLGPPVTRPTTIVAIGFNYRTHGATVFEEEPPPSDPVLFLKPLSALSGPTDDIVLPFESTQTDYEVELTVVIGRGGRRIPREQALDHIAGYTVSNDVSARDIAFGAGPQFPLLFQIARAKGYPTFCPTGPWLVTADEVGDPSDLRLTLSVNGEPRQDGTTADMTVDVAGLVASVSEVVALRPGDMILTGTPFGCGFQIDPPRFLKHGDRVVCGIEGLGEMRNAIVAEGVRDDRPGGELKS